MARFSVEGCIGAGKSACLEVLRQLRPQWEILEEPVSTWEQYCPAEGVHVNLLKNWYDFPSERSFRLLQSQVIQSLLDRYTYAEDKGAAVTVFERSLMVSLQVFLSENKHNCCLPEYYQMEALCVWGMHRFETPLHKVYLTCSEEVMINRVIRRGRSSEQCLTIQQLLAIQRKMDSWARNAELFIVDTSEMTAVEVAEAVADWSGL